MSKLKEAIKSLNKACEEKKIWWNTLGNGDELDIRVNSSDNIVIGVALNIDGDEDYYEWEGKDTNEVARKIDEFVNGIDGLRIKILLQQQRRSEEDREYHKEIDEWLTRQ